jgi:hypothetical protein
VRWQSSESTWSGMKYTKSHRQQHAHKIIERNAKQSGTRRGFGTGAAMPKGTKKYPTTRVREVFAMAQKCLDEGMPKEEVIRRVMCVALIEPSIYQQARKLAPRHGEFARKQYEHRVQIIDAFTPGVLNEPTVKEVAKEIGRSVFLTKLMLKHNRQEYDRHAFTVICKRLTPGEFVLLKALQHARIREMSDRLAALNVQCISDPQKPGVTPPGPEYSYAAVSLPPKRKPVPKPSELPAPELQQPHHLEPTLIDSFSAPELIL